MRACDVRGSFALYITSPETMECWGWGFAETAGVKLRKPRPVIP